tara:strand:- start:86 stop:289 length:204 start_codon:yes stop_codon:yes gene_type:complete
MSFKRVVPSVIGLTVSVALPIYGVKTFSSAHNVIAAKHLKAATNSKTLPQEKKLIHNLDRLNLCRPS